MEALGFDVDARAQRFFEQQPARQAPELRAALETWQEKNETLETCLQHVTGVSVLDPCDLAEWQGDLAIVNRIEGAFSSPTEAEPLPERTWLWHASLKGLRGATTALWTPRHSRQVVNTRRPRKTIAPARGMGLLCDLPPDVLGGPLLDALLASGPEAEAAAAALRLSSRAFATATRGRLRGVARARAERVLHQLLPRYRLYPVQVLCGPWFVGDRPLQVRAVRIRLPRGLFFIERVLVYRYRRTGWWVTTKPGTAAAQSWRGRVRDPPEAHVM